LPNTLLTPQVIANELLMRFQNNLTFAGSIRKHYDDRFAKPVDKTGDKFKIRVPVRYGVQDGPTIVPEITEEREVELAINKNKVVAFKFSSKELTLDVSEFGERYLKSAAQALANQYDLDLLKCAYEGVSNFVGTPGTVPTSLLTYQQASTWLDEMSCPVGGTDRFVCYNSRMQTQVLNDLRGLQESAPRIRWQYEEGRMKRAAGMNWLMDQNIGTHTTGSMGGTPTVTSYSGKTLSMTAWTASTAGVLKKNDIIQVAGRYAVNPITKASTGSLRNWTLAADVTTVGSGVCTVTLTETIEPTGPYQNVSSAPASGDLVRCYDVAAPHTAVLSKTSPQGLVYHTDFLVTAMVPMVLPDGVHFAARQTDAATGMTIAIVGDFNILTREFIYRADIMYGSVVAIPEWACRVVS
jgi:hypothetical protein